MDENARTNKGSNKLYFVVLLLLSIVIICLVVGVVISFLNNRQGNTDGDAVIEVSQENCKKDSELFDAKKCANYVYGEVPKICLEAKNKTECYNDVFRLVDTVIEESESEPVLKNDLNAFLVGFCVDSGRANEALELSNRVNEEQLSREQKYYYYGYLSAAYYQINDKQNGDKYMSLSMNNLPEDLMEE